LIYQNKIEIEIKVLHTETDVSEEIINHRIKFQVNSFRDCRVVTSSKFDRNFIIDDRDVFTIAKLLTLTKIN